MEVQWRVSAPPDDMKVDAIAKEAGVSRFLAAMLVKRGITASDEADKFINPSIGDLHSPRSLKDIDKGTDIIIQAIKDKTPIVVYGDYDCDGVTSTAIMYKGLIRCGAKVSYHIPDRIEEGYGLNSETIRRLHEKGAKILLTCDNGISSVEQVALAKELNMAVVVTDHHEVPFAIGDDGEKEEVIPPADAVINPKQHSCNYPFKGLCGAGVAFKFIHTLYHKMNIQTRELYEFIEIAMLGTICDVVDLVDENRIIVSMGLKMLNNTRNTGLKALIKEVGYEDKRIRAVNVGFQLGPCINATGRLYTADLALELLLTKDAATSAKLAKRLHQLNMERQALTDEAMREAVDIVEMSDIKDDRVLVVYKEGIHESLAGIVAGRLRELYNKPTYVITKAKDKAKGSGRSIEEYDMFEEISKCKDILLGAGGHPMAAGFSLAEENIPLFREKLNEVCTLTSEDLVYKIDVDQKLELKSVTYELIEDLEKLEPFGKGNKEPLFLAEDVVISRVDIMGKNKNVFRLLCSDRGGNVYISGIRFSGVEKLRETVAEAYGEDHVDRVIDDPLSEGLRMDILFKPNINEWNGKKTVQMRIMDYKIN